MKLLRYVLTTICIFIVVAPNSCFADWGIENVYKERAKELGIVVRSEPTNHKQVMVNFEFQTAGELKDFKQVDLQIGERHRNRNHSIAGGSAEAGTRRGQLLRRPRPTGQSQPGCEGAGRLGRGYLPSSGQ